MGKYIVRNGDLEGRKIRLESGAKITLGRERADMSFFDKRMSRRHCTIEVRNGVDLVRDLGSTNGTWVNNQRITEGELKPGDILRVGFTELEFLGSPEPAMPVLPDIPVMKDFNPNQTIAFRAKDLLKPPPNERRKRFTGKSRLKAAKSAAMGQKTGERQYISAKGKFCEACGEAIFVKEGAPDEGMVVDGAYLCRMCALISEKQKELGKDGLMMNYAKIVHGSRAGGPAKSEAAQDSEAPMEIIEEEVSLEDLTGPDSDEEEAASPTSPDAPAIVPDAPEAEAPMKIIEEEVSLEDLTGPDTGEETAEDRAPPGVSAEALPPAAEAPPDLPSITPGVPEAGEPGIIVEEEVSLDFVGSDADEKASGGMANPNAPTITPGGPEAGEPGPVVEEEVKFKDLTDSDAGGETAEGASLPFAPAIAPGAPEAGASKQIVEEEVSLDFLGSDADEKADGGTAPSEASPEAPSSAAEAPPESPEVEAPMKIVEEEVSLEDLTGPVEDESVPESPASVSTPLDAAAAVTPEASPDIAEAEAPMKIVEEEVNLEDLTGPVEDESSPESLVPVPAPLGAAAAVTPEASPYIAEAEAPMKIVEEEVSLEDLIGSDAGEDVAKSAPGEDGVPPATEAGDAAGQIRLPGDIQFEAEPDGPKTDEDFDVNAGEGDGRA